MYLINFSNQIAAGPKNIAKNFFLQTINSSDAENYIFLLPNIDEFKEAVKKNAPIQARVKFVNTGGNILTKTFRTIYINLIYPYVLSNTIHINGLLCFGNFLLFPGKLDSKVVLLHHPYIVDDKLYKELNWKRRFGELLKRIAFEITSSFATKIVVQSDYMANLLINKNRKLESKVAVISNPLSRPFEAFRTESLAATNLRQGIKSNIILFVSRFYPHKNHFFLIELGRALLRNNLKYLIQVTIDETNGEAAAFMKIAKDENLPIQNIGELDQKNLSSVYQRADIAIFPSLSETFGNPLIEGLCFSLPTIALDLPYAKEILGDCGIYFDGTAADCLKKIILLEDSEFYRNLSIRSARRSEIFPTVETWQNRYCEILRSH